MLQLHVWVLLLVEFKYQILRIVAHAVITSGLLYLLLLPMKYPGQLKIVGSFFCKIIM